MNNAPNLRTAARPAFRWTTRVLLVIVLLAGTASTAQALEPPHRGVPGPAVSPTISVPVPPALAVRQSVDPAIDPFLAGVLGIIPFTSGLYLTDQPGRGMAFTAVDVLMALGVYSSRYTVNGNPDNAKLWFLMMAANNVLDALVSVRMAERGRVAAFALPTPDGGMVARLHVSF